MSKHSTVHESKEANIYKVIVGCGGCGRFCLYIESHHSEHTQNWIKATCAACGWTERRPLRTMDDAIAAIPPAREE